MRRFASNGRLAHHGSGGIAHGAAGTVLLLLLAERARERESERMSAMEEIRSRKLEPIYNALERCADYACQRGNEKTQSILEQICTVLI